MHSLQDLLDLTDPEHRFVTLSQCAVAAALEVPSYAIVELLNTFEQTNPGLLAREIADDLAKGGLARSCHRVVR